MTCFFGIFLFLSFVTQSHATHAVDSPEWCDNMQTKFKKSQSLCRPWETFKLGKEILQQSRSPERKELRTHVFTSIARLAACGGDYEKEFPEIDAQVREFIDPTNESLVKALDQLLKAKKINEESWELTTPLEVITPEQGSLSDHEKPEGCLA